jgi:hypothetical protein
MTGERIHGGWPGDVEWGGDWLADTAEELARLGFELRDGLDTGTAPGPRLLVALRATPTLTHFDPEEITFWEAKGGRGRVTWITRETPLPLTRAYSWGKIVVSDRIPESNTFLGFGGTLLAAARSDQELFAAFTSKAPIVRWAGHSQGVDPLADEIGSFFARLMVPIDFQEGAEARIAEAAPETLYAAFIHHTAGRLKPAGHLRDTYPELARFIDHERHRLPADAPFAWRSGEELLGSLELG